MKYVQCQKMYHFHSSQIVTTLFGDPLYASLGGNEVWILQGRTNKGAYAPIQYFGQLVPLPLQNF